MRFQMLGWFLCLCLLSGCPKKPPTQSYKDALDALNKARNAKADKCAKDELKSAERMMARAKQLMDSGKYDEAKSAFDAARKLAEKAKEEARLNKGECDKPKNAAPARRLPAPPTVVTTGETPVQDNRKTLQTIYFGFNRSKLSDKAQRTLRGHAEWLNKHSSKKIEIAGHCDQRGSVEYNLALGERRALTVKQYLINLGIPSSRISVISYGHQKPADPRNTTEAYAKNRRAEFRVSNN